MIPQAIFRGIDMVRSKTILTAHLLTAATSILLETHIEIAQLHRIVSYRKQQTQLQEISIMDMILVYRALYTLVLSM